MEDSFAPIKWKYTSLTCVQYPVGDLAGMALAYISLAPIAITISMATAFAIRRDLHTFVFGVGVIVNYAFNMWLKHTIKDARPPSVTRDPRNHWDEYGMPSSHAQFMAFFTFYLYLYVGRKLKANICIKLLCLAAISAVTTLVLVSRVYLEYHSLDQVYWGSAIGAATAVVWFGLTEGAFRKGFPFLLGMPLAKLCKLKSD